MEYSLDDSILTSVTSANAGLNNLGMSTTSTTSGALSAGTLYQTTTSDTYPMPPIGTTPDNHLIFHINDEIVEFSGVELVYLREMLTEWIEDNRPESLL